MLEVKDLHVRFHNRDRDAVGGISFSIADGEILGLVGESGSGKTVTAMSIAGLLPRKQCSYSGDILLNGQDLLHADRSLLRKLHGREIGVVFQEPMTSLNPVVTVGDQLREAIKIHQGLRGRAANEKAVDALRSVGIPAPEQRVKEYPHQLSGGMRQRVMIAMALACEPDILIADEPTTALDVTIQAQILELIQDLQKKMGMAVILVTHDLGVIADMCDNIVVMYGGRICERGTAHVQFINAHL